MLDVIGPAWLRFSFGNKVKGRIQLLLVTCTIGLIACSGRPGDGREGGSDKVEWSILQSLEVKHRGTTIHQIEFVEVNGYHIVCVPRDGDQVRLWIMTDPKSPPFYKQGPTGNYWLSREEIEDIRKRTNPISTVLEVFESHRRMQ